MKIVSDVLGQMTQWQRISLPQRKFLPVLLTTMLIVRGKLNFLNLSRYCALSERTLRRHFGREFDWPLFNRLLVERVLPPSATQVPTATQVVALDASFVKKSGKKTYGLGWFFNGCSGRAEKGLEVSLVSLIDVDANTAYALSVRQTVPTAKKDAKDAKGAKDAKDAKDETSMDFYLRHLKEVQKVLPKEVRYGVFDGAFAKKKFVSGVREMGLHVVSKLRCDANLRYLYEGPQKKRGRRKLYDGKVLFNDLSRWQSLGPVTEHLQGYTVLAHHQGLQRVVRVLLLLCDKVPDKPRYVKPRYVKPRYVKPRYVLLFSSEEEMPGQEVYRFYKARFQMEFLFRDAKQWTGLSDCQARDEKALHFHFNAALTAVNVMKVQAQGPSPQPSQSQKRQRRCSRRVFSLASCKQRCYNEHLLETFIHNLDLEPSWVKSHPCYQALCNYGAIAN